MWHCPLPVCSVCTSFAVCSVCTSFAICSVCASYVLSRVCSVWGWIHHPLYTGRGPKCYLFLFYKISIIPLPQVVWCVSSDWLINWLTDWLIHLSNLLPWTFHPWTAVRRGFSTIDLSHWVSAILLYTTIIDPILFYFILFMLFFKMTWGSIAERSKVES